MIHRAKKSLGQNFLKSQAALRTIALAGEIKPGDTVLEIGPGKGALTEKLLEKAGRVIAVEKDRELCAYLREKFAGEKKLELLEGDILDFEPKGKYKIIANIPYNITGAILKRFLTMDNQPERMILLVQKEVAQRILARDGKESVLSVSVKAYGEPKMILKVPARFFSPAPKVDSAVICVENISRKLFKENKIDEKRFWEVVRLGFSHKRKKLSGNLRGLLPAGSPLSDKRAEDLALSDWITLVKASK